MSTRIDDGVDLSRSEVARVADALQALIDTYGSRRATAEATCIGESMLGKVLRRPAAMTLSQRSLRRFAAACGCSVDELISGRRVA